MKAYKVFLTGAAIEDIDEACAWYGNIGYDLKKKFTLDLENTLKRISENPDAQPKDIKK